MRAESSAEADEREKEELGKEVTRTNRGKSVGRFRITDFLHHGLRPGVDLAHTVHIARLKTPGKAGG